MAHFLCIDDEKCVFTGMKRMLTSMGHTADYADSPGTALSMLGAEPGIEPHASYDGIICDNFMEEKNAGIALLTKLRTYGFIQPMILHTSNSLKEVQGLIAPIRVHYSKKGIMSNDLEGLLEELFASA